MVKHSFLAVCVILTTFFMATETVGSRPDQLGALNFTLYSRPHPVNDMGLRDLTGAPFSLAALRGKVVILNFWKIDCIPCSAEKPILERIHRKYASRGLAVVALNLFDNYERMRDFLGRGGFSFTFAYDPEKRFSVQTQTLGSGMPTCFVVNPNSEAIYEIPVVPTTYVINRDGQIVGHSYGMINWEQGPFMDLLESLLGPPTQIVAHASPPPATLPKHTSVPVMTETLRPPPHHPEEPASEVTKPLPSPSGTQRSLLPFQGSKQPGIASSNVTPADNASRAKMSKGPEAGSVPRREVSGTPPRLKENGAGQSSAKKLMAQGRPVSSPPPQSRAAAPPASSVGPYPDTPLGRSTMTSTVPPTPIPAAPASQSLPAAMPYTPHGTQTYAGAPGVAARTQRSAKPAAPDGEGYVMARIPGQTDRPGEQPRVQPAPGASRLVPALVPTDRQDTFSGLVLDSFGTGYQRPDQRATAQPSKASGQSVSSFFGQLSKIPSGIRDALTRPLSGR